MREANEVYISLELLAQMVSKGHRIEAEVIEGVGPDAELVGARVAYPYTSSDAGAGVLVLRYDRPVPEVMLRDLRSLDQRIADSAESASIARSGPTPP